MKQESQICPCCGAKIVEYKFSFNKGLAVFLRKLIEAEGVARTDDLALTYSQRTNSQKLRYWGLAEPVITEDTKVKRGVWTVTAKGIHFFCGRITIPKYAITKRGEVIRFEGDEIKFNEVAEDYMYHQDYADQVTAQLH